MEQWIITTIIGASRIGWAWLKLAAGWLGAGLVFITLLALAVSTGQQAIAQERSEEYCEELQDSCGGDDR